MRRARIALVIVGAVLALGTVALWLGTKFVSASLSYEVEATFDSLPKDDRELEEWLRSQPGIVPHTVHVRREGDEHRIVVILFIMVRDGWGQPPLPDFDPSCKALGYTGQFSKFKDR